jgi:outer membrane immunogenic protein
MHVASTAPYLSWAGPYVGINGGYGFANSNVLYIPNDLASALGTCGGAGAGNLKGTCIASADFRRDGPLVGGQVGYNYQITSKWLVGGEADYQWADLKGGGISAFRLGGVGPSSAVGNQTVESFGTIRARLGVIFTNPLLLYGTAGLAFGQLSENFHILPSGTGSFASGGFSYSCLTGVSCFAASANKGVIGWTAGVGAEYALTTNLTFKTEVLYVDLGGINFVGFAQGIVGPTAQSSFFVNYPQTTFFVLRGGLNYRF